MGGIQEMLAVSYPWIKAIHVMAVIAWMAGLFYLPRLFVYHVEGLAKAGVVQGSDMDLLFRHQERLLLRAIMWPAMVVAWVAGLALVATPGVVDWGAAWAWVKAGSVLGMTWFHHWLALRRKDFVLGRNRLSGRDFRLMNEVPTLLMVAIVSAVIVKF